MLVRRDQLVTVGEGLRVHMLLETDNTLGAMGVMAEELRDPDLHLMDQVQAVRFVTQGQVVASACRQLIRKWQRVLAREEGE